MQSTQWVQHAAASPSNEGGAHASATLLVTKIPQIPYSSIAATAATAVRNGAARRGNGKAKTRKAQQRQRRARILRCHKGLTDSRIRVEPMNQIPYLMQRPTQVGHRLADASTGMAPLSHDEIKSSFWSLGKDVVEAVVDPLDPNAIHPFSHRSDHIVDTQVLKQKLSQVSEQRSLLYQQARHGIVR